MHDTARQASAPKRVLLTMEQVRKRTSLSRSRIYEFMRRGAFPQAVPLAERWRAWIESEIEDWIDARVAEREATR